MKIITRFTKLLNLFAESQKIYFSIVICLFGMGLTAQTFGQASLLAEDTLNDIKINNNGHEEIFTVVRDGLKKEQWYYIPDKPRIYEQVYQGKAEPEFTLIKYQFDNPDKPGTLLEGGLLQFSASLALPATIVEQILQELSKRIKISKENIRLAPMPIKSAEVSVFSSKDNVLVGDAPEGSGIAPTFATQKMAFSIPLTAIGADVYDGLVNSNTGVRVAVVYTYKAVTPDYGFKINVDWDQTYEHYSKNERFRAEASYFGWFGASYTRTSQSILDELRSNKCIDIEVTAGETFTYEQAEKMLQPILARINQEMLESMKPPQKLNPATLSDGDKNGSWFSANYSVSTKSATDRKRGKETLVFRARSEVERKTLAAGFIGIGQYDKSIRDKLVFNATGTFQRSFFLLPKIINGSDLGIEQVTTKIMLRSDQKNLLPNPKTVIWSADSGWTEAGKPTSVIAFGLGGYGLTPAQVKTVQFDVLTRISMKKGSPLEYTETLNAFNGTEPVSRPTDEIDIVTVDGSSLSWKKLDPSSKLEAVQVLLKSGDRNFSDILRPQNVDGKWLLPKPLYWVVRNGKPQPDPINVTLTFILTDGSKINWRSNGEIRTKGLSPTIVLLDSDWNVQ